MPLYDWKCTRCLREQQQLQKFTDPPPHCEFCATNMFVERQMSVTRFELKGKGWASDGYSSTGQKK